MSEGKSLTPRRVVPTPEEAIVQNAVQQTFPLLQSKLRLKYETSVQP
jgi:hypothetical protein